MMGRTHYKIGMLTYILLFLLPAIPVIGLIQFKQPLTLVGILFAGLGAYLPDLDSQHSTATKYNPLTALPVMGVNIIKDTVKNILKITITIGIAGVVYIKRHEFIAALGKMDVPIIKEYRVYWVYGTMILLVILAISSKETLRHFPVIGSIYRLGEQGIEKGMGVIKRLLLTAIYLCIGVMTILYNLNHGHQPLVYLAAAYMIGIAIFPHRTLLHSLEGFLLFTVLALTISAKVGYVNLGYAAVIGYFSHLYLSDILTSSGIPLSVLPTILRAMHLEQKIKNNKFMCNLYKILDIRLKILPGIQTGSTIGNTVELAYIVIIGIAITGIILKCGLPTIQII